jgi:hydrogenase maturation protease
MATGDSKERPTKVGRLIIIGIGNPHRGDDSVGLAVSNALRDRVAKDVEIVDRDGEATRLIDTWKDTDAVILVDAVSSGSPPGTIHEIDARETRVPPDLFKCSTHSFGVAEAIELSRALGTLPGIFRIYGIEGTAFDTGTGLSPEAEAAVEETVSRVLARLASD